MTQPLSINAEGFVRRFAEFGRQSTVERYVNLFTPTATVQHPGMPRPLVGHEIRDFISSVLASMPDFELRPLRWCSRGDIAFVEAESSGSRDDRHARWSAIYCVQLRGDQVLRGRSFYDRAEIFAQLENQAGREPASPVDLATTDAVPEPAESGEPERDICRRYAEAWAKPDAGRIANFFGAAGSAQAPGTAALTPEAMVHDREAFFDKGTLRQHCQEYAAGRGCAFLQWELAGTIDGSPFTVVAAERLVLNGPKIAESRIYFDTLAFEAFRDPSAASRTVFDAVDAGGQRSASKSAARQER